MKYMGSKKKRKRFARDAMLITFTFLLVVVILFGMLAIINLVVGAGVPPDMVSEMLPIGEAISSSGGRGN